MSQLVAVPQSAAGERLDLFLAANTQLSRSQLKRLIVEGQVQVNGHKRPVSYPVQPGDDVRIDVPVPAPRPTHAVPTVPVMYQDDDLVIVNKPAGLVVHPGAGTNRQAATLVDFARTITTDPDPERPGIVHRLDRDTSGLLVIARTPAAKTYLQAELAARRLHKTYTALLVGRIQPAAALIDLPLGRDPQHPLQQAVVPGGRAAQTKYETTETYPGYSLVAAHPITGRTHQLRVHFAAVGHPIAGDTLYGAPTPPAGLTRQFLHASRLQFIGPSGQSINVACDLPDDLQQYLSTIRNLV